METFAEIVRSRANDTATGLRFEDDSWTWAEIVQASCDRAAVLEDLVPQPPADRQVHVGVLLDNVPDFVFWIGACALSGAVLVGLNSSRTGMELAADARHAEVDVIVTERRLEHLVRDTGHGVPSDRVLVIEDPAYAALLESRRDASLPDRIPADDAIAMLLFSSGSTGRPKAVIVGQGRLGRLTRTLVDRVELTRDSVTYLSMPLFHGNSVMMNLAPAMAVGATVGMTRKFSASRFSSDVHRFGATYVNYVGRALSYVLSQPEDPRDRTSTLELAFGTEASEADVRRMTERFGVRVSEGYGMSEGAFRINRTPDTPVGALGKAAGGVDVRVMDETTGQECPRAVIDENGRLTNPEAIGQLVGVGLAHTFEGYWKNPDAVAERVRGADFWSGDLAFRDQDGWFWFAGRSSDWLRVDSENFAAAQVERILQRMPGVRAAPVFAVPDPTTGDRVMCAVELEPGGRFDPDAFAAFLDEQPDLGAKWWPSFVRVIDAVPLTGSNKVDKAPLRRSGWATNDPVYVRVERTAAYEPLDDSLRERLEQQFAQSGRTALLPA